MGTAPESPQAPRANCRQPWKPSRVASAYFCCFSVAISDCEVFPIGYFNTQSIHRGFKVIREVLVSMTACGASFHDSVWC